MNDKSIDKIFGYMVIAVVGYFIIGPLLPYLIGGAIGLLILRYFRNRK